MPKNLNAGVPFLRLSSSIGFFSKSVGNKRKNKKSRRQLTSSVRARPLNPLSRLIVALFRKNPEARHAVGPLIVRLVKRNITGGQRESRPGRISDNRSHRNNIRDLPSPCHEIQLFRVVVRSADLLRASKSPIPSRWSLHRVASLYRPPPFNNVICARDCLFAARFNERRV